MSKEKESPVCIVTGGTSGIGLATAKLFAATGYRIASCGRNKDRLAHAESEIGTTGVECWFAEADLTDSDQAVNFAKQAIEKFGRVDVLVNNAGMAPLAPFDELTEQTFESAINLNVRSVFYVTQVVWRQMKQQQLAEQGRGVVINISSLAAIDPFPGFSIYGSTKAWLDLMSHALAAEGKEEGISVYSIRPGAVETPLLRSLFPDFPAGECVQPGDVAQKALDMVQMPAKFETGNAYNVTNQAGHSNDPQDA